MIQLILTLARSIIIHHVINKNINVFFFVEQISVISMLGKVSENIFFLAKYLWNL